MKRFRFSRLTLAAATLLIALFGISAGRSFATSPVMPHMPMPRHMSQGPCQTSCGSQSAQQSQPIAPERTTIEVDDQNLKPQPADPYYLAFMGVGWTTVITIAAAYLIKYLRWRPPDLFKLNVNYQF